MAETKFKVFAENSTNIYNNEDYSNSNATGNESSRVNGNQPNTLVESKMMNTALKMATMISKAIIDVFSTSEELGLNSTIDDLKSDILLAISGYIRSLTSFEINQVIDETSGTKLIFKFTHGEVSQSIEVTNIIAKAAITADSATSASKASNLDGGTAGAIPYQSAVGVTNFLTIGTNDFVLCVKNGVPKWINQNTLKAGYAKQIDENTSYKDVNFSDILVFSTQVYPKYINGLSNEEIFENENSNVVKEATAATEAQYLNSLSLNAIPIGAGENSRNTELSSTVSSQLCSNEEGKPLWQRRFNYSASVLFTYNDNYGGYILTLESGVELPKIEKGIIKINWKFRNYPIANDDFINFYRPLKRTNVKIYSSYITITIDSDLITSIEGNYIDFLVEFIEDTSLDSLQIFIN